MQPDSPSGAEPVRLADLEMCIRDRVRTAVRLTIDGAQMRDMEVGEWSRR